MLTTNEFFKIFKYLGCTNTNCVFFLLNSHKKELQSNTDTTEILKPAPSWSNVAIKSPAQQQVAASSSSSSAGGGSSGSAGGMGAGAVDGGRPSVGGISTTSTSSMQLKKLTDNVKDATATEIVTVKGSTGSTTQSGSTDDESKGKYLRSMLQVDTIGFQKGTQLNFRGVKLLYAKDKHNSREFVLLTFMYSIFNHDLIVVFHVLC